MRIDPAGKHVHLKRRLQRTVYNVPGPNYIWHIDGYAKLSRFGFSISGCIDGASKFIIWLEVAFSNQLPQVTLSHYANAVMKHGCLPSVTRTDFGSENPLVAACQQTFLGDDSYINGPSTGNQRIERFWGNMHLGGMKFWTDLFKSLKIVGKYDSSNTFQISCAHFVFGAMNQKSLHDNTSW